MRKMLSLIGRKKSGKGSLFNYINANVKDVGEFWFAKPIKDFCINTLGLTHDQMYGTSEQRESPTEYKWADVAEHIRKKYNKTAEGFLTARNCLQVVGSDTM